MNRKGFQMASCGKDVVHRVVKVTSRCLESGNVIHSWLKRRVRWLARPSPRGGSRPGSSRGVKQAGRVEIRGQATLVHPLMDGVRCALVPFEPLVVGIQASYLSGNLSLPGLDPGGLHLSVPLSLCNPLS